MRHSEEPEIDPREPELSDVQPTESDLSGDEEPSWDPADPTTWDDSPIAEPPPEGDWGPVLGPSPPRRDLLLEMGAVLALSCFVWLYNALASLWWGGGGGVTSFVDERVSFLVYDLQVCLPLLFILARSGEPWARFGIVRPHDVMVGLVIFLAVSLVPKLVFQVLDADFNPAWSFAIAPETQENAVWFPSGPVKRALLVLGLFVGAFKQELVFRGYLIPRLRQLGSGLVPAVLVSSALFASIHFYQGGRSTGLHLVEGLLFGGLFLHSGSRLWPVVIAHALFNLNLYYGADVWVVPPWIVPPWGGGLF